MRRRLGAEMALAEMESVSSEVVAAFVLEPAAGHAERERLAGTVLGPGRGGNRRPVPADHCYRLSRHVGLEDLTDHSGKLGQGGDGVVGG